MSSCPTVRCLCVVDVVVVVVVVVVFSLLSQVQREQHALGCAGKRRQDEREAPRTGGRGGRV